MNRLVRNIIAVLSSALLVGCTGDSLMAGSSILTYDDSVLVSVDTFDLQSSLWSVDSMISWPDSFMIGEMENKYGRMHAELMTQLACPEGFAFPTTTVIDSMQISFNYRSYYGDGNTPLAIDVKQMDKATFDYSSSYLCNLPIEDYVSANSPSILDHRKVVVASQWLDSVLYTDGTYATAVRATLSQDFVEKFQQKKSYTTQEDFNNWFKGLYIYSDFGGSTILNVTDIMMTVYYSFTYMKGDEVAVVHDTKDFYANSEVRQVSIIRYDNKEEVFQRLQQDTDHNYILAPANIYTKLDIPMGAIKQSIVDHVGSRKRPYVNMAKVRVRVDNIYDGTSSATPEDWSQPAPYMLLIKASAIQRFFLYKELPSDTCALLGALSTTTLDDETTAYYYEYELASMLTNQLRQKEDEIDILHMVLIPVAVQYASSSSTTVISAIKQQQTISATQIWSAQKADSPMSLEVVYSGF